MVLGSSAKIRYMTKLMSGLAHPAKAFVQALAEVRAHRPASERYFHLVLHCPEVARRSSPGQFALLACQSATVSAADPLLPRPLAMLDADPNAGTIEFLYFVAGRGTNLLKDTVDRAGQNTQLRVIGPLGRGFQLLAGAEVHVGVGGGSGVAPLIYFFRRMDRGTQRHLILAARSRAQLATGEAVALAGVTTTQATDDGSAGFHGNAVEALADLLEGPLAKRRVALYVAGPEPMMLSAVRLARARHLQVRVSLEARMACGVGVCRGCVVNGRAPHPKTGLHRYCVCQDGPVFDPDELDGEWCAGA
jgi:dihydroorotate dehydrogenase electron transfer subunit